MERGWKGEESGRVEQGNLGDKESASISLLRAPPLLPPLPPAPTSPSTVVWQLEEWVSATSRSCNLWLYSLGRIHGQIRAVMKRLWRKVVAWLISRSGRSLVPPASFSETVISLSIPLLFSFPFVYVSFWYKSNDLIFSTCAIWNYGLFCIAQIIMVKSIFLSLHKSCKKHVKRQAGT